MQNLILYINLIASHFLMYERSSTAPPPYLYRVLLEIHMSFTKPSERNSNSPLALQRAGPARAWRPRTGLFGKVFSTGLHRVKHGVVRNVKIVTKIWGISQNSLYLQLRKLLHLLRKPSFQPNKSQKRRPTQTFYQHQ